MFYCVIQVFFVEIVGMFDLDVEFELFFFGVGKVCFEFIGCVDICKIVCSIVEYVFEW